MFGCVRPRKRHISDRGSTPMSSITVFLADDHAIVRDGLRYLLDAQTDIKVIGDASEGREAVRQISKLHPDIVIMDIAMPQLNGLMLP